MSRFDAMPSTVGARPIASLVLIGVVACSPSPAPGARPTDAGTQVETSDLWVTYSDVTYGFEFDTPAGLPVHTQTDGPFQVLVYTDPENPFYFRASRDYLPNDALYLLDTSPTGTQTLGQYTWQTYSLPDGYGDALGFSPPIYALQLEVNSVLYAVLFYNQDSATDLQLRILSTFRVIE